MILTLRELERRYALGVLRRLDGNRAATARALGISARTLRNKLVDWGVREYRGAEPAMRRRLELRRGAAR